MNKSKDILKYLESNPGWVLQHCRGVRSHHWWWLRKTPTSIEVIKCNGNAARAAACDLVPMNRDGWQRDTTYVLRKKAL